MTDSYYIIGKTRCRGREVSTVFLGNLPPSGQPRFESLLLSAAGEELDGERYQTERDARDGHMRWAGRLHNFELSAFPHYPCGCARFFCAECGTEEQDTHISTCAQGKIEGK